MQSLKQKFILILWFILGFAWAHLAYAATLYFDPAEMNVVPNQKIVVPVRLNVDNNESINLVTINLKFPQDLLDASDVSFGNSILSIIPQPPLINQEEGIISFAGGIPGGYSGHISGDSDLSNLLAKIIFQVKGRVSNPVNGQISFQPSSQVYLNNGLGTPTTLSLKDFNFSILTMTPTQNINNNWQDELNNDKIPPETFKIYLQHDKGIFNNQHFIIFSTTDKQTGVDYYEIKEGSGDWQIALSPYVLKNQKLNQLIQVKAVDKAGNIRLTQYVPESKLTWYQLIIYLVLLLIAIAWISGLLVKLAKKH